MRFNRMSRSRVSSSRREKTSNKKTLLRSVYRWARFFHIFVSATLFALLIFFCVTGVFLNHLDWFSGGYEDRSVDVIVPRSISGGVISHDQELVLENIDVAVLSDWLSGEYGLKGLTSVDFDLEVGELIFDYSLPAGYASAIYLIEDKKIILDYRKGNIVAIMNDLHKGRHSGVVWSWAIDISAVLMVVFSLTGFFIIFQSKKHRRMAVVFSVIGLAFPVVLYFLFVPRILGV